MINTKRFINTKRYDRQLRLWHAHGQLALSNAKVCLINANATAAETLKNLVLPGIGSFTIIDNAKVTPDSINKPRGQVVTELLCELNDQVSGSAVDDSIETVLNDLPDFFNNFTLVIATQVRESVLLKLADLLWKLKIPLIVVRSYGFIGYTRICLPEHNVVETHPDAIVDLRLDVPFPSLSKFCASFDITNLDSMASGHVPYVVILFQVLNEFRTKNGGKLPTTSEEKKEFKKTILAKIPPQCKETENFEEALAAAYRVFNPTKISSNTKSLLEDSNLEKITSGSFWILAKGLLEFVNKEGNGQLPVAGTLPDMKADTESYVALQKIYKEKAREDASIVYGHVVSIMSGLGLASDTISLEEVERFCKNSDFLQTFKFSSLNDEYSGSLPIMNNLLQDLENNAVYYVLIRAADLFYETHRRYPGVYNSEVETDIAFLKTSVSTLLSKWGISPSSIPDDQIHSFVRAGNSELHVIASLQGGIVSQEAIKLLTSQYIPLNNTLIFNGIKSTSSSFEI